MPKYYTIRSRWCLVCKFTYIFSHGLYSTLILSPVTAVGLLSALVCVLYIRWVGGEEGMEWWVEWNGWME